MVWHFEFASSCGPEDALRLQRERRHLIVRKHPAVISQKLFRRPTCASQPESRAVEAAPHTLDRRAHPPLALRGGIPACSRNREMSRRIGCAVTLYPAVFEEQGESWESDLPALPRTVEVAALAGYGPGGLRRFLQDRKGYYDLYFMSRPDTMRSIRTLLGKDPPLIPLNNVIYDAEALFSNRERLEAAVAGKAMTDWNMRIESRGSFPWRAE